jgi:hypothetical protein
MDASNIFIQFLFLFGQSFAKELTIVTEEISRGEMLRALEYFHWHSDARQMLSGFALGEGIVRRSKLGLHS